MSSSRPLPFVWHGPLRDPSGAGYEAPGVAVRRSVRTADDEIERLTRFGDSGPTALRRHLDPPLERAA